MSLFVFVQASNVYPQLLLARLLFSIGGAATSTMVTATLPTMTMVKTHRGALIEEDASRGHQVHSASLSSDVAVTTATFRTPDGTVERAAKAPTKTQQSATGQVAGLVGMFTGVGALIALGLFLPLPARLQKSGSSPAGAVTDSFYIVGVIALVVAVICFFGLRGLNGEEAKGWSNLFGRSRKTSSKTNFEASQGATSYPRLLSESFRLCFTDKSIGLGCLGGFVARASSVGISLFIPLFVNHYFISSGLCKNDPHSSPSDIKNGCRRAYMLAAALSGVSQLVALMCAPLFGYLDSKLRRFNVPLMVAAVAGIVGYVMFAQLKSPDPKSKDGSGTVFVIMALLGISQIGSIVCSLSLLGRGIQASDDESVNAAGVVDEYVPRSPDTAPTTMGSPEESSPLLPSQIQRVGASSSSRNHLKGSIAGWYSLAGGAGILLLTKLGGYLFDSKSTGAPFYMLAAFNGVLLAVGLACNIVSEIQQSRRKGLL